MKKAFRFTAIAAAAAIIGCTGEAPTNDAPPTDDPECQIQAEGEQSPGYPYDLELFANSVLPTLVANCSAAGCHGPPVGQKAFTVWPDAARGNCNYAKTFNSTADFVDLANPANSALVIAVNGANAAHPVVYPAGDERLAVLETYAADASARFLSGGGNGDPAPPGASPFDYNVFQTVIQPVIDTASNAGCATSGCHGTGAGNFTLVANPAANSAEMEKNFLEVTRRTNLNTPETSLFYLQALTVHAAGASTTASPDQGQQILAWIQAAKDVGGGAPDPGNCAPADRFSAGVFRDEILPILRGDLDLNNPGGGTTTGCVRGPCHGTDRGPGILFLSDGISLEQNLQNFACFVDLTNPSASEVLTCPLDDPRCRKFPHPGQDVFGGANDLNYQRLLSYLYGSKLDATPLDYAFFVRRINPIFNDLNAVEGGAQGRTCADATFCHGVSVVGQAAPNGSNFPIIANAADNGRLSFNFVSAANFVNFLNPEESSLFLYPTNEIANVEDHPLATGLPHPGGEDFAVDSNEARLILQWAEGLRPDGQGFVSNWLVAGDYPAAQITDLTPIDEVGSSPKIFDPTGTAVFNNGQWDGLFSPNQVVDLNTSFPRAATNGRIAYAAAYALNTTTFDINALITVNSPNAVRIYVGSTLVAQSNGGEVTAVASLPAYATSRSATRILVKVFQRAQDDDFEFTARMEDEFGVPLTNVSGELVFQLGPEGGI